MPPDKSSLERGADLCEQGFRLLRDAALGVLFLLLFIFPNFLKNRLVDAGFTKISPEGVTWEKEVQTANSQSKAAAMTVDNAAQSLGDAKQTLAEIEKKTGDPSVKAAINKLNEQINGSIEQVQQTDSSLKRTMLTQQTLLAKSNAGSTADNSANTGWIYLGEVDQSQGSWMSGSPVNIVPVAYPLQQGQSVTTAGENYLRGDSSTKQHRDGKILSVLRDGTRVQVIKADLSHALNGGWFVWLQVSL
jgi:DNA-binding XRE family transcriptional regulator